MAHKLIALPEDCFNERGCASIVRVPRPLNTQERILVAVSSDSDRLYEMHATQARHEEDRCWFVDQLIVADPRLITATPLDPTFIVASLLLSVPDHARSTYSRFEDITDTLRNAHTDCDILPLLHTNAAKAGLERCCESKELAADEMVYKLSEPRYLGYVDAKIARCLSTVVAQRDIKCVEPPTHHLLTPELTLQSYKRNMVECVLYNVPYSLHTIVRQHNTTPDLDAFDAEQSKQTHQSDTLIRSNKGGYDEGKELDREEVKKPAKASRGAENLKKVDTSKMMKLDGFFAKKPVNRKE
ncbi:hypothetical protein E3P89_03892 [Wallemia ichthyophaga]|uniref:Ribonuclease H2 subunit B n=1 Tax=Wallemia ichthyophaga TaxID=245174 RepID=A0A4T0JR27_WALIC|nr:hypothetical protein E3P91_03887 [Wallemia ichthyophaga]TIA78204.1 hypothetical protein E3P98_03940 [Wallemia ichthyophaga]TIA87424.1 hypothetical protein E3P97_03951 [Wallemia ichthyophaga]TIA95656.1 hypothetical protein E3P95_03604 [Wallemia ichthyophaga]TIA96643.1 hypothetical protein E3P94_03618 [Wallemia ichthyophaga]